jgi:hypothetical protein
LHVLSNNQNKNKQIENNKPKMAEKNKLTINSDGKNSLKVCC